MKIAIGTISVLAIASFSDAFAPPTKLTSYSKWDEKRKTSSKRMSMAVDLPPAPPAAVVRTVDVPEISAQPGGAPAPVRYSEFIKLVRADRVEKVTFSADGMCSFVYFAG